MRLCREGIQAEDFQVVESLGHSDMRRSERKKNQGRKKEWLVKEFESLE